MTSTCFTAPGEGATVRQLLELMQADPVAGPAVYSVSGDIIDQAWTRLLELAAEGDDEITARGLEKRCRTNVLILVKPGGGGRLEESDFERLAKAEVSA